MRYKIGTVVRIQCNQWHGMLGTVEGYTKDTKQPYIVKITNGREMFAKESDITKAYTSVSCNPYRAMSGAKLDGATLAELARETLTDDEYKRFIEKAKELA